MYFNKKYGPGSTCKVRKIYAFTCSAMMSTIFGSTAYERIATRPRSERWGSTKAEAEVAKSARKRAENCRPKTPTYVGPKREKAHELGRTKRLSMDQHTNYEESTKLSLSARGLGPSSRTFIF